MMNNNGMEIFRRLEKLAAFGPRWMGTKGAEEVRSRIAAEMESFGLQVELQPFEYLAYREPKAAVYIDNQKLLCQPLGYAAATKEPLRGRLVYIGQGTPEDIDRVRKNGHDLSEAVVLSDNLRSFVAYPAAEAAGAKGFLLVTTLPDNSIRCGSVRLDRQLGAIPGVSIGGRDGRPLIERLSRGETIEARLELECKIEPDIGRNVIGRIPGRSGEKKILVSAHYDSFWNGVHIMDNLAGVATMLELAGELPDRVKADLEFIAFGGEELGCWGAAGYVGAEKFSPQNIRALVNLDTIGSVDSLLEIGVTADLKALCQAAAEKLDLRVDCWNVPPRAASDQQEFVAKNVPAVWLANCGADPRYHTPLDCLEEIRPEKLDRVFRLAEGIVRELVET